MGPADVSAPGGEPGVGHPGVGPPGMGHPNRTRRSGWGEGAAPLFLPRVPGHVRCTSVRTQHPHSSGYLQLGFMCKNWGGAK